MEIGSSKLDPYKTKEPFFVGAQLAEPGLSKLSPYKMNLLNS